MPENKKQQPLRDLNPSEQAIEPLIDVERGILGCLLSDPGYYAMQEIGQIKPEHFYGDASRRIYRAILTLVEHGAAPDLTLTYQQDQTLDPVDLANIRSQACMPSQLEYYANLLRENFRGRCLERALVQSRTELASGTGYEQVEERLLDSLQQHHDEDETLAAEGKDFDVEALLAGKHATRGITFGLAGLDAATGGLKRSEVCILAARTNVGKSALAIMTALNAVSHGTPVLYVSLEMSREMVWRRILSYWSRVSLRKFRDDYFDQFDAARVRTANQDLHDKGFVEPFRVNCKANRPSSLLRLIRMEQIRYGDDLFVIVDHAGRMQTDSKSRSDYERSSEIANRLKDIAIACNIPMLALWQLNRALEKDKDDTSEKGNKKPRKPTMADLRDTGQAEEIADLILLCTRDSYYDHNIPITEAQVVINIAKARDGGKACDTYVHWLDLISRPESRE